MKAGDNVLLKLPTGDMRIVKIETKGVINLGKFGSFKASELVGRPYGLTYEINADKTLKILPPKTFQEVEETGATNELINDGEFVQPLTSAEIAALKATGVHVDDIIQKQIEQHANYQLKTEYSKDKYKKRKEAKFSRMFSTLEPTVFNSCEYWFNKDPAKIRHIRIDTLGQMMSLANVQPGGRYLVVDDTAGMVIATMLERIGGLGRLLAVTDVDSPPVFYVLHMMNFDSKTVASTLTSLNWAAADENHISVLPPLEPSDGDFRSDRQKAKLSRRKAGVDALNEAREELFAGEWDGLVVASQYDPYSVVETLSPYLAGSASIVVYSPHLQVVTEAHSKMRPLPQYLAPSVTESWLRPYQVLPGRTHPMMNVSGSGGYLLHAINVYDSPAASSLTETRRNDRKQAAANKRRRLEQQDVVMEGIQIREGDAPTAAPVDSVDGVLAFSSSATTAQ